MKLSKMLIFLLPTVLLAACQGEPGKDGLDGTSGVNGKDGYGAREIYELTITSRNWEYSSKSDNNYYYAEYPLSALTDSVYKYGNVQVYMYTTYSNGTETQRLLPCVQHYQYQNTDSSWGAYTQTTDYEYSKGKIIFYITNSDFYYNPSDYSEPGDRSFRIIIQH